MSILWYQNLYTGEKASRHRDKIKWKLEHRVGTVKVFLLTMPSNEQNSLDILNAAYLKQPHFRKQEIRVVGLALSYEEALEVLVRIVEEVYEQTDGMDIKEYIYLNQENWRV